MRLGIAILYMVVIESLTEGERQMGIYPGKEQYRLRGFRGQRSDTKACLVSLRSRRRIKWLGKNE